MSIHEKLAASIKDLTAAHAAELMGVGDGCCGPNPCIDCIIGAIKCGLFSDILGVREPTIEDVRREAVRVFGAGFDPYRTTVFSDGWVLLPLPYREEVRVPSISAAYAALRTLPDYEVSK